MPSSRGSREVNTNPEIQTINSNDIMAVASASNNTSMLNGNPTTMVSSGRPSHLDGPISDESENLNIIIENDAIISNAATIGNTSLHTVTGVGPQLGGGSRTSSKNQYEYQQQQNHYHINQNYQGTNQNLLSQSQQTSQQHQQQYQQAQQRKKLPLEGKKWALMLFLFLGLPCLFAGIALLPVSFILTVVITYPMSTQMQQSQYKSQSSSNDKKRYQFSEVFGITQGILLTICCLPLMVILYIMWYKGIMYSFENITENLFEGTKMKDGTTQSNNHNVTGAGASTFPRDSGHDYHPNLNSTNTNLDPQNQNYNNPNNNLNNYHSHHNLETHSTVLTNVSVAATGNNSETDLPHPIQNMQHSAISSNVTQPTTVGNVSMVTTMLSNTDIRDNQSSHAGYSVAGYSHGGISGGASHGCGVSDVVNNNNQI